MFTVGKRVERHRVHEARRKTERRGIELRVVAAEVLEAVVAVAHGDRRVGCRDEDVVQRKEVNGPEQQAGVRVAGHRAVRTVERRPGLLRVLMGIHARHRPAVRPALIDLQRLLVLRTIVERGLAVERLAGRRQRHRREHRSGDRVDPIGGNDVAGKRVAHDDSVDGPRRQRVVDGDQLAGGVARLREIAGALGRRRQRQHVVARAALLVVVGAEPEERPVLDDRTTDRTGPVVVVLRRILQPRPLRKEQRPRRRTRLADEQRAAVPGVRPRAGRGVEDAARRVPHVGLVGLGLHLQLFHRLHRRGDGRAIGQVGDRHAFDQVAVAAPRAAAERQLRRAGLVLIPHELRIAGLNDARRRDGREERVAPEDRQVLQGLLVERRRLRRARALDERRFAGDGHLLARWRRPRA